MTAGQPAMPDRLELQVPPHLSDISDMAPSTAEENESEPTTPVSGGGTATMDRLEARRLLAELLADL